MVDPKTGENRASKELYCLHIHKHILAKNKYAQGFSPAVQPTVEWQRAQSRGAIGGTRGGGLVLVGQRVPLLLVGLLT